MCSQLDSVRLSHLCDLRRQSNNALLHDARCIGKAVMDAVDYCHKKNIIIRNLTPSNICARRTSSGFIIKIADFSLAVMNGSLDFLCDSHYFNWSQVPFMAPEALLGNPFSFSMDVWAIGVLMFMMVTNSLPFSSDEDADLMNQITVRGKILFVYIPNLFLIRMPNILMHRTALCPPPSDTTSTSS